MHVTRTSPLEFIQVSVQQLTADSELLLQLSFHLLTYLLERLGTYYEVGQNALFFSYLVQLFYSLTYWVDVNLLLSSLRLFIL